MSIYIIDNIITAQYSERTSGRKSPGSGTDYLQTVSLSKKKKKKHHTDIKMKIFSLGLILSKGKVGVTSGGQLSQLRLVI